MVTLRYKESDGVRISIIEAGPLACGYRPADPHSQ